MELVNKGSSLEEIATQRGLALSTIEGHAVDLIKDGRLDANKFLTDSELKEIIGAIEEFDTINSTPLKEALDDKYGYGKIKMAVAHYINKKPEGNQATL